MGVRAQALVRDRGALVTARLRGAPQPEWLVTVQGYERKRR